MTSFLLHLPTMTSFLLHCPTMMCNGQGNGHFSHARQSSIPQTVKGGYNVTLVWIRCRDDVSTKGFNGICHDRLAGKNWWIPTQFTMSLLMLKVRAWEEYGYTPRDSIHRCYGDRPTGDLTNSIFESITLRLYRVKCAVPHPLMTQPPTFADWRPYTNGHIATSYHLHLSHISGSASTMADTLSRHWDLVNSGPTFVSNTNPTPTFAVHLIPSHGSRSLVSESTMANIFCQR
jgi:hypothetical protein